MAQINEDMDPESAIDKARNRENAQKKRSIGQDWVKIYYRSC